MAVGDVGEVSAGGRSSDCVFLRRFGVPAVLTDGGDADFEFIVVNGKANGVEALGGLLPLAPSAGDDDKHPFSKAPRQSLWSCAECGDKNGNSPNPLLPAKTALKGRAIGPGGEWLKLCILAVASGERWEFGSGITLQNAEMSHEKYEKQAGPEIPRCLQKAERLLVFL